VNTTLSWLRARRPAPPERLIRRMEAALTGVEANGADLAGELGEAAVVCLRGALAAGPGRAAALDLLAADALLTYACEAAADGGAAGLERFAAAYGPARLARLLSESG
jgi:hypothetical protein